MGHYIETMRFRKCTHEEFVTNWKASKHFDKGGCSKIVFLNCNSTPFSEAKYKTGAGTECRLFTNPKTGEHELRPAGYVKDAFSYLTNDSTPEHPYPKMRYPASFTCVVYDCGVCGWVSKRKVRKIVDHHVQEVVESKYYKSKPKTGLKGGTIDAVHAYYYSFDEHDFYGEESTDW